jgi:hypothetical protein
MPIEAGSPCMKSGTYVDFLTSRLNTGDRVGQAHAGSADG